MLQGFFVSGRNNLSLVIEAKNDHGDSHRMQSRLSLPKSSSITLFDSIPPRHTVGVVSVSFSVFTLNAVRKPPEAGKKKGKTALAHCLSLK